MPNDSPALASKEAALTPDVAIYVGRSGMGAAASGESDSRLSPEQISALHVTVTNLISGFQPPEQPKSPSEIRLDSLEVEIGLKLETGAGGLLKLLLDTKGEASIRAKVVWSRPKG